MQRDEVIQIALPSRNKGRKSRAEPRCKEPVPVFNGVLVEFSYVKNGIPSYMSFQEWLEMVQDPHVFVDTKLMTMITISRDSSIVHLPMSWVADKTIDLVERVMETCLDIQESKDGFHRGVSIGLYDTLFCTIDPSDSCIEFKMLESKCDFSMATPTMSWQFSYARQPDVLSMVLTFLQESCVARMDLEQTRPLAEPEEKVVDDSLDAAMALEWAQGEHREPSPVCIDDKGSRGSKASRGREDDRGSRGHADDHGSRGHADDRGSKASNGSRGHADDRGSKASNGSRGHADDHGSRGHADDHGSRGHADDRGSRGRIEQHEAQGALECKQDGPTLDEQIYEMLQKNEILCVPDLVDQLNITPEVLSLAIEDLVSNNLAHLVVDQEQSVELTPLGEFYSRIPGRVSFSKLKKKAPSKQAVEKLIELKAIILERSTQTVHLVTDSPLRAALLAFQEQTLVQEQLDLLVQAGFAESTDVALPYLALGPEQE